MDFVGCTIPFQSLIERAILIVITVCFPLAGLVVVGGTADHSMPFFLVLNQLLHSIDGILYCRDVDTGLDPAIPWVLALVGLV